MTIKTSDVVVFTHMPSNYLSEDITLGKEYTIAGIDEQGNEPYFMDDADEYNWAVTDTEKQFTVNGVAYVHPVKED